MPSKQINKLRKLREKKRILFCNLHNNRNKKMKQIKKGANKILVTFSTQKKKNEQIRLKEKRGKN